MNLICVYDSAVQTSEPRWIKPMPPGQQRWWLKLWAQGHNGEKLEHSIRPRQAVDWRVLREQLLESLLDEIREECGGITRFRFWLYKAR